MRWVTIDRDCIYAGCALPLPHLQAVISSLPFPPQTPVPLSVPGVAIDLYDIQQLIFRNMGPN